MSVLCPADKKKGWTPTRELTACIITPLLGHGIIMIQERVRRREFEIR